MNHARHGSTGLVMWSHGSLVLRSPSLPFSCLSPRNSQPNHMQTGSGDGTEDELFEDQVLAAESFIKSPRFKDIKRPYSGRELAAKQGTLRTEYASSVMARKLWDLLRTRAAEEKPVHTLGVIDPVQMTQQAAKQEVLYVSGWACSSTLTTTNEVSPDFGDYPYNTVPNQVQRLFKAQQLHDRKHWDARRRMSQSERAASPYIDYLRPIIADGDTGHGGLSAVFKLAKLFAENGAAAVHFEDQLHGGKKCGHLAGKVLVPVGEHVNRLIAARLQWDIMMTETVLIARTDAESGKLLSSAVDVRDHEFILGVTEDSESLAEVLQSMDFKGASRADIDAFEADWVSRHRLITFDEAVESHLNADGSDASRYLAEIKKDCNLSLSQRRKLADQYARSPVQWSCDIPRTREGFYHYRAGVEAAAKRAINYGPYSDLLWLETGKPSVTDAAAFAGQIHKQFPGKPLVYNLSPSFNWLDQGFNEDSLRSFIWDLVPHGFVLQLVSLAGLHSTATMASELSQRFYKDGMQAYVELVQARERQAKVDVFTHQKWSGAELMDGLLGLVQGGNSGTKSMGSGNTEANFDSKKG